MGYKNLIFSLFSKRKSSADKEEESAKSREPEEKKKFRLKDLDPDEGFLKEEPGFEGSKESAGMDALIETVEDWNDAEKKKELGTDKPEMTAETADPEAGGAQRESAQEPRDAEIEIAISEDKMSASILVNSPAGGGRDITLGEIKDLLEQMGIEYGIDEDKLRDIAENELYNQVFEFAAGTPPVDGKNGKIKDFFPRRKEVKFASKENGSIDFKSTNYIHNVKAGEVVCELTPPEPPEDGVDIFGNTVYGKAGIMPPIPQGKNVIYNEEKDKLITACEGNLSFRSGRFHVEKILNISGNVDNSVGNIDFTGSVSIKGDVLEGFTVRAKGDITVMGIVEGATLTAVGNIILYKGMRGMKTGILEAGGDITAKFLEDCRIYAKGDIQAEHIINSDVSCGNNLTLTGRRAAFIGGVCSVYNQMNVKTVGAMSQITTLVTLGVTPQLLEEVEALKKEIAEITAQLEECKKNIAYLNNRQKAGSISPKQNEKLNELKIWLPVSTMKQKKLKDQMQKLTAQLKEVKKSRLAAREIYGGTIISIGDSRLVISRKEENCSYYYADGQIKRGLR